MYSKNLIYVSNLSDFLKRILTFELVLYNLLMRFAEYKNKM